MRRLILVALAIATFALVQFAALGGATPASFQLVFVGHNIAPDFNGNGGVEHIGTFTTNSPLCPSGSGHDIANSTLDVATRLFTCDSGATFTATLSPHVGELTGSASWRIISGTGPLANLRGTGTLTSVLTAGDLSDIPNNLLALAFISTWTGTVDLDPTPPTLAVTRATIKKVKRPAGTYRLAVALAISDNDGDPVSYALSLIDPRTLEALERENGSTSAGSIGWTFSIKPSARTRQLRLEVDATDQVGNQTSLKQTIALKK